MSLWPLLFSIRQPSLDAVAVKNGSHQPATKGVIMEFTEKARIRIQHWIKHNQDHLQEYETFARELDDSGKSESARHIRKMAASTAEGNASLEKALQALE
jgi:hypothetical protein